MKFIEVVPYLGNESCGVIFKISEPDGLRNAIIKMQGTEYYNSFRFNVFIMDFKKNT